MKTYTVEFEQITYTSIDVKARNASEAIDKAFKRFDQAKYERCSDPELNRVWEKK